MIISHAVRTAIQLFSPFQEEQTGSTEMNEQDITLPTKARFTMSYNGKEYACEDCGETTFRKTKEIQARCAREACGLVYSVDYPKLDLNIIYYMD